MFWEGFEKRAWSKDTLYRRIRDAAEKRLPPPSSETLSPVSDTVRAVNRRFIHNQATRSAERYLKGDRVGAKKAVSRLRTILKKAALAAESSDPQWDKGDTTENLQEDGYTVGKVTVDMKPEEDAADISQATHRESGQAPQNPFMGY